MTNQNKEDEPVFPVYILYFDGGSRGNPGPGGAGYVLYKNDIEISSGSRPLGRCTNNHAEYNALIMGLEDVKKKDIQNIVIRGDSLLVLKQCQGAWKVKSDKLRPLWTQAIQLLKQFDSVELEHVKRAFNKRADQLANEAMDENTD
jgi:ribonuclease HI